MWNNQGGFQSYDQGGQGFNSPGGFGTPQQSQEKRTRQRAQNIIPVTVAEIINTTQSEEKFYSGDIEILQVTMVGLVRAVKESATRIDYEIDDMTGPPLEVKQFVDNDESVPEEERVQAMRENTYVRVTGTVRAFGGKKSVVAFKMSPVKDMNELTYHILDVIHTHASYATKPASSKNGTMMMDGNMSTVGYEGGDSGAISGLTAIQNQPEELFFEAMKGGIAFAKSINPCWAAQVHTVIRNNPTSEGASLESVFKQIRGVPEKAIRDAIEFLSGEGHIYSTVDDDHFKATDS